MTKRSSLADIAAGVSGAAIAGFGFGIGRDAWKAAKKSAGWVAFLLLFLAALVMPFFGGRNLVRGYPRQSIFLTIGTIAFSILLTVAGLLVSYGLSLLFLVVLSDGTDPLLGASALALSVGFAAVAFVIGVFVGIIQRPSRMRAFAATKANQRFLDALGFRETGEEEITHYDGDGNPLRLQDRAKDAIVFLVVGRRNRRAYIELDGDGMMTGYTGVIGIDEPRIYKKVA